MFTIHPTRYEVVMLPYTVIYRTDKHEEVPPAQIVMATTQEKARQDVKQNIPNVTDILWTQQTDQVWDAYKALWQDRHPTIR